MEWNTVERAIGEKQTQEQRMKRSGQARLIYVFDINCNIPTTWRWARGDHMYVHACRHTHAHTYTHSLSRTHCSVHLSCSHALRISPFRSGKATSVFVASQWKSKRKRHPCYYWVLCVCHCYIWFISVTVHLSAYCAVCSVGDDESGDADRPNKKKKGPSLQTRVSCA